MHEFGKVPDAGRPASMTPTDSMCLVKGTWAVGSMGASRERRRRNGQIGLALPTTKRDPCPFEMLHSLLYIFCMRARF